MDSIKSWRKYIRDKYRENDSEFIYILKIIRENKKFEAGIIKTIGTAMLVGTLFNNFINLFLGKISNKNLNISINGVIITIFIFFILYIGIKNILQDINRQNLQQMFIESVIDTLIIK